MKKSLTIQTLWGFPLLTFALDANAWGLFTHIYFAQYIAFTLPIFDPNIRRAIKKFPTYVMAGACLPDLALVAKPFKHTHQWQQALMLLNHAKTDEERALAAGYTSHLFVDVLAHNHFVPAFEAKWLNQSIVTHVVAEWAMDAHIANTIHYRPKALLCLHKEAITQLFAHTFEIPHKQVTSAVNKLAFADDKLRMSRLASGLLKIIKKRDDEFVHKLDYYLHKTKEALIGFEQALLGNMPTMQAELLTLSATDMHAWREKCLADARIRLSTPLEFHLNHQEQLAPKY
jgi:hypothetical protein